jgi:hypothetical protein
MTEAVLVLLMLIIAYIGLGGGLKTLAPEREYKSGTGWCVWRWTRTDSAYILRLHVVKTPWFAVCLHWIQKPDAEPWLHDHPVSFFSIILRGKYCELRQDGAGEPYHKVNRWFNFVRASNEDRHRIIFTRANTLTLCLMGPKTREWGFHMPEGWIVWRDYYARLRAGEDMRRELTLAKMDKMLDDLMAKYTGPRIVEDIDVRSIDTAPADDFVAEPPTEPR